MVFVLTPGSMPSFPESALMILPGASMAMLIMEMPFSAIRKSHPSDDVFSVPAQQVIEFFDGIIAYEHDPDQSDPCVHETLLSYV